MLYGRLLDNNSHRCESLAYLSYPVVLLQSRKSGGYRFIECLRGDLYGVLNVSDILYRNCARSKNHVQERSIFAICSPIRIQSIEQLVTADAQRGIIAIASRKPTRRREAAPNYARNLASALLA